MFSMEVRGHFATGARLTPVVFRRSVYVALHGIECLSSLHGISIVHRGGSDTKVPSKYCSISPRERNLNSYTEIDDQNHAARGILNPSSKN
jgi:hypothetical protein